MTKKSCMYGFDRIIEKKSQQKQQQQNQCEEVYENIAALKSSPGQCFFERHTHTHTSKTNKKKHALRDYATNEKSNR